MSGHEGNEPFYLAETNEGVRLGKSYQRLKTANPTGKLILVRRCDDEGKFPYFSS